VRVMKRAIPAWREKVAEQGHKEGSASGPGRNASGTTALPAAGLFSGAPSAAGCAGGPWPRSWTDPYKGREEGAGGRENSKSVSAQLARRKGESRSWGESRTGVVQPLARNGRPAGRPC
jgi:hypothetical protein